MTSAIEVPEDASLLRELLREGSIIGGRFRVERVLSIGGMGIVLAAEHLELRQRVALKVLFPASCASAEATARFLREARAAAQIRSEHVVRIMDVAKLEDGPPYIVMEFLEGQDLDEIICRRGPLPIDEAIDCLLQAGEAVAEAHVLGIVHRDLKPANIFVTHRADGSRLIKVLDFGIAKIDRPGITKISDVNLAKETVMGTPGYMSPEQISSSGTVDARTDIWALGAILHELVTGTPAFDAKTLPRLFNIICSEPPPPLRSRRPDAPPALEAVVLKCLEKDPERRFSTVAELALELASFATPAAKRSVERIVGVVGRSGPPADVDAASSTRFADPNMATRQRAPLVRMNRIVAFVLLLAACASVAVGLELMSESRSTDADPHVLVAPANAIGEPFVAPRSEEPPAAETEHAAPTELSPPGASIASEPVAERIPAPTPAASPRTKATPTPSKRLLDAKPLLERR